jgi:hypothetical protein
MFEYTTVAGNKVSINPKYIVAITDYQCNEGQCCIDVVCGESWIVAASYDTVRSHYGNWLTRCG